MKKQTALYITGAASIAALYVVLTLLSAAFGLAGNNLVQVRLSEALTILPFYTPAAIPGLFVGCIISNLFTGANIFDIVFGSLATLAGAFGTYALRKKSPFLACVSPILSNVLVVPFVLRYAYGFTPLWLLFLTVAAGEVISCGILGTAFLFALKKYAVMLFGTKK